MRMLNEAQANELPLDIPAAYHRRQAHLEGYSRARIVWAPDPDLHEHPRTPHTVPTLSAPAQVAEHKSARRNGKHRRDASRAVSSPQWIAYSSMAQLNVCHGS